MHYAHDFTGPDAEAAYKKVYAELQQKYPGHILPESDLQWVFMNAGGWMRSVCIVHASLTEYVLFIGTPVETMGHSGIVEHLYAGFTAYKFVLLIYSSFNEGDLLRLSAIVRPNGESIHSYFRHRLEMSTTGGIQIAPKHSCFEH